MPLQSADSDFRRAWTRVARVAGPRVARVAGAKEFQYAFRRLAFLVQKKCHPSLSNLLARFPLLFPRLIRHGTLVLQ